MPIPNHCIDCDKVATVTLNNVPYCVECGIKEQQINDFLKWDGHEEDNEIEGNNSFP